MTKILNFKGFLVLAALLAGTGNAAAASLLEVYQQALQSDPRIHEAEARRLAALEREPQARGVLLPQVQANGSWTTAESSGPTRFTDPRPGAPLGSTLPAEAERDTDRTFWSVSLRQTLFRWDQIVGLRRADKEVAKAEADREAAQQDLIIRVSQTYFDVLGAEDRLTSSNKNRLAIARQLEQAKQRFDVGLIAITDVQESQAAYDQAVADEIAAKRDLATRRELLREITGEYISALSAPKEEFPLRSPNPSAEKDWVDLALGQNLALVSSRLDERLARDEISFRRNGYYPTIDLVASTGETDLTGDVTVKPEDPVFDEAIVPIRDNSTDNSIRIEVTVPLFTGGSTSSRVREAVYLHRAAREQLQRVTRETERATRDAYLGVLSEKSRVEALAQAVKSSETALEATEAGFEVGTRTIVDVLNSQTQLYDATTNYYQSRYDYVMNVLKLKQAAGSLEIQDLEDIDEWLEARQTPEDEIAAEAE